jgi:septal ring factor EnvC (AmiA/AmiB activator)
VSHAKLDFKSECKLGEAAQWAGEQRFVEAVEACLEVVSGPDRAVDVLRRVCESWQKSDAERIDAAQRKCQEELNSMNALLMAARDRSESLRKVKDDKDNQLRLERERRQELEEQSAWLRRRSQLYEDIQRENSRLKQELREARRAPKAPSKDDVARQLAEFECVPLRTCSSADRAVMRKKLLLKWHPDKQPSTEHAALATQIMQELQNRPEWDF